MVVPVVFGSSKGGALVPVDGREDALAVGVFKMLLKLSGVLSLRLFSAAFWIMTAVDAAMVPMNAFLPIAAAAAVVLGVVAGDDGDDFKDMEKASLVGRVDDTNTTAATEHKTLFFEIILFVILFL